MKNFARYFLRGLVITAPVAFTVYICWVIISKLDGLIGINIPGVGAVVAIAGITLVGALASNYITRTALAGLENLLERLPFVRLLYTSTKDLLNAFVGEQRRFNKPVRVRLFAQGESYLLGFVTADSLDHLGLAGHVAVYLPTAYNYSGNLIVVASHLVDALPVDSADLMAFIVSGGVSRSVDGGRQR